MEAIKETIQSVIQELANKKKGAGGAAPEDWLRKAMTRAQLKHIKFQYFKAGVLGLNVDSSAWLYKFNLQKEDLLGRLNKHSQAVKDIYFRLGAVK